MGQRAHAAAHVEHTLGVEAGAGLVENEGLGIVHERAGDERAARLAGGERHDVAGGKVGDAEQPHGGERPVAGGIGVGSDNGLRDAEGAVQAAGHDVHGRQVHGHLLLHGRRYHAQAALYFGERCAVATFEEHGRLVAVQRQHLARDKLHERRLARPVRPEQGDVLAARELERVNRKDGAPGSAHDGVAQLKERGRGEAHVRFIAPVQKQCFT